ncbi:chemotaxis protein CheB [Phaeobacter sp. BS52]|uniref:chemotaxis protein CheB n=1 Tax=Phaeobacter sp. BS52 TaxID=2907241 RepID=UPI00386C7BB4
MTTQTTQDLTIIGIGSSAGGLEAIRELVATLPVDVPAAYVVVQHMSPHHKSLMTELVARQTQLKVGTIQNGTIPEANVVYITPPKSDVIFSDGRLHLLQDPNAEPGTPRPSVDRFLVSLAEQNGDNSMAIILSGTGSDGAYGVQAIREAERHHHCAGRRKREIRWNACSCGADRLRRSRAAAARYRRQPAEDPLFPT